MIILDNITKRFPVNLIEEQQQNEQIENGYFYALKNISFTLENCNCTVIAGANGSGKSLLMSIISGLEEPSSGSVKVSGSVGLVFQEPDTGILGDTPREDIAFGPRNKGIKDRKFLRETVEKAMIETGLQEKADFPSRSLSGGEKRRLAAAGVLAMDANIIIFDEPYANLDYPGIVQVNGLFQKLIKDGKKIIILTHEIEKCLALCERFIVLYKGKKIFDGSPAEALSLDIEEWGIHHPLNKTAHSIKDLLWL